MDTRVRVQECCPAKILSSSFNPIAKRKLPPMGVRKDFSPAVGQLQSEDSRGGSAVFLETLKSLFLGSAGATNQLALSDHIKASPGRDPEDALKSFPGTCTSHSTLILRRRPHLSFSLSRCHQSQVSSQGLPGTISASRIQTNNRATSARR